MADIIKEFLVGLGVKVDEAGLRRFDNALKTLSTTTKVFAASFTGLIVGIEESLRRVGRQYEALYYLSQQTGIAANTLKAMEGGFKAVNIGADQFKGAIESVTKSFVDTGGAMRYWVKGLVPDFNELTGTAEQAIIGLAKYVREQAKFGEGARAAALHAVEQAGFDRNTIERLSLGRNLEIQQEYAKKTAEIRRAMGLDTQEWADKSAESMRQWGLATDAISGAWERFSVTILTSEGFQKLLKTFVDWLGGPGAEKINEWADRLNTWFSNPNNVKDFNDALTKTLDIVESLATGVIWLGKQFIKLSEYIGPTATLLLALASPAIVTAIGGALAGGVARLAGAGLGLAGRGLLGLLGLGGGAAAAGGAAAGGAAAAAGGGAAAAGGAAAGVGLWPILAGLLGFGGGVGAGVAIDKYATGGVMDKLFQWIFGKPEGTVELSDKAKARAGQVTPRGTTDMGTPTDQMLKGLQDWWSGASSFRPIVQLAEDVYKKFSDTLRDLFFPTGAPSGASPASYGGEGGGAGGAGGGRVGVAAGGRMPGRVPTGGAQAAPGTRLTLGQMKQLALDAGFPAEDAANIAAIAMAESGGNPYAHNPRYPDDSYGITQINRLAHPEGQKALGDPKWAMEYAFKLYQANKAKGGSGFRDWSTYTGGAYKQYLEQAQQATPTPISGGTGGGAPGGMGMGGTGGAGNAAAAVDSALSNLGMHEQTNRNSLIQFIKAGGGNLDPAAAAWCAAYVNASLQMHGIKGTGSNVANSFQRWGQQVNPQEVVKGDVLLQTGGLGAGQTGGHVGFASGRTRIGPNGELEVEMVSGNKRDRVSVDWVKANSQLQARRGFSQEPMQQAGQRAMQMARDQAGGAPGGVNNNDEGYLTDSGSAPLGPMNRISNTSNRNVNSAHNVTVNVHGATDPHGTARAVADAQDRHSMFHSRNLRTALA